MVASSPIRPVLSHRWLTLSLVIVALASATCTAERSTRRTDSSLIAPPPRVGEHPVIRPVGPFGSVPTRIVIDAAHPVVDQTWIGRRAIGFGARLSPNVGGELRWAGRSTLDFVPDEPLQPGTTYHFSLASAVEEGGPRRWEQEFTTPAFRFSRIAPVTVEIDRHRVDIEVTFSAAVDVEEVASRSEFFLLDRHQRRRSIQVVSAKAGESPGAVVFRLSHEDFGPRRRILLVLEEGVPAAGYPDQTAAAVESETVLPGEARMTVKAILAHEASGGWSVEVVCDDRAVDERRYYWDRQTYRGFGRISSRCVLQDEDFASRVHIEPAVELALAPSSGGFRLMGAFERGPYVIRIDSGARTVDGATLAGDYEQTLTIPARSAQLSFVAAGRYLPRSAWGALALTHLNVEEIELVVRHVPAENLVFWMSEESDESASARTANVVARETIVLSHPADEVVTTSLDVGSLVPSDTRGLIEVTVVGGGVRDAARIVLTDLQLFTKRAGLDADGWPRTIFASVIDAHDLTPVSGAEIAAVRRSGKTLDRCTSGPDGSCQMVFDPHDLDREPPFALVARHGDELTYLRFNDVEADIEQTRVAGDPYRAESPYRAALYTDRGVYRPGEATHVVGIVREASHQAPPAGLPVRLHIRDARGRLLRNLALTTNAAGLVATDVVLPAFATTGRYEVRLEVADRLVGDLSFQVEEIVPERLEVSVATTASSYLAGEMVEASIEARYLFGGVPDGHRVELECSREPTSFTLEAHSGYRFGPWRPADEPARPVALGTAVGVLGVDGRTLLACPGTEGHLGRSGPAQLRLRAAVFEAGSGRTTVGRTSVALHPSDFYIGLLPARDEARAGEDLTVDSILVAPDGRLVEAPLTVTLSFFRLEEEWGWYYDEALGRDRYRRFRRPVLEDRRNVTVVGGRSSEVFSIRSSASGYVVEADSGDAHTSVFVAGDRRRWSWRRPGGSSDATPRPGRPSWLSLDAAESVRVGEEAVLRFIAPYRGRALVAIETDTVIRSEWIEVAAAGPVQWRFTVPSFAPNVYLSALVVKDPHLVSDLAYLPDRALGVRSVTVEPTRFVQPVRLITPEAIRSGSPIEINLELGPLDEPVFATVAAVDEGILSLTGFPSPDPLAILFAQRALGVRTGETVGWSLSMPGQGSNESPGGDRAAPLGRVLAVEPVALWSGVVAVPRSGRITLSMDVPEYQGALRVMAVTVGPTKIGHATARVVVRDPIVLQPTLPRFLSPGDEITVPVQVTNQSGERRSIDVALEISGAADGTALARVEPIPIEPLDLDHGGSGTIRFRVVVGAETGFLEARVVARSDGIDVESRARVPIHPTGSVARRQHRIALTAGMNDLTPALGGWLPFTERSTFRLTPNPYADVIGHLRYLVRYPYGCIEQTISSTRPLLYVPGLIEALEPELVHDRPVDDMIRHGIDRLLSMQTPAGGFAYWPGGTEPVAWGTAHASQLLLEASELGHPVPEARLGEALSWIERELDRAAAGETNVVRAETEAYLHFVLARAGRGRKARMLELVQRLDQPSSGPRREARFLLEAGLYLAGDQRFAASLLRPDLRPVTDRRVDGWSFYSDRRRRGLMLAILADLFGPSPATIELADLVAESLRGRVSRGFSTQELAWAVSGLAQLFRPGATSWEPPTLWADGRRVAPLESDLEPGVKGPVGGDPPDLPTWELYRASEYEQVALEVPLKGEGTLYLVIDSEGVSDEPAEIGGSGLRIERRYVGLDGTPVGADEPIRLGDLVFVVLEIENRTSDRATNIALVDRIPAGWEIENPRLGREQIAEWIDPDRAWLADHLELRDDRLEMFGHLEAHEVRQVVYLVRAVSGGHFTIPPADLEAMYDARLWARTAAGTAHVLAPGDAPR